MPTEKNLVQSARPMLKLDLSGRNAFVTGVADDQGFAWEIAKALLALPASSVRMSKESINAYATIGAHAASHMAHDQVQLAAMSAEAKAARDAFALRRKSSRRK